MQMLRLPTLPVLLALAATTATATTATTAAAQQPPAVHSVSDISQEFTFYMDGRFHTQYLRDVGHDERNWGSLARLDLSNVNLLLLSAGDRRIPYTAAGIANVERFVRGGGALLLMADGAEPMPPGAAVAAHFGARLTAQAAERPFAFAGKLADRKDEITCRGGTVLELGEDWQPLVVDKQQRPVLACRTEGKGTVLASSRGLFGERPDAKDPINAAWITPLLVGFAAQKPIDPQKPHRSTWVEHERKVGPLLLEYHDGTAPFADRIAAEYQAVRPHLVAVTGVEPSPGMISRLLVLPTGGGGFSSGERIAIGAFWGNYPEQRYPMVELIAHEAGHSWVLPYAEPLWNEPIATYLGILVGKRLELPDAQRTLEAQLRAGRKHDPDYTKVDPQRDGAPRDLVWGKSFFVFEELDFQHGPGAMAKYFRSKRAALQPGRKGYSLDDCVAVWSRAVGADLFPWFRSLGFAVDPARVVDVPRGG